ncbi:predicted protein [Thalassiosira pseudonana CCMP1335]|uniref:Uncharacterized protein n=1 Tax=Thalassiosira pseudonana TaxID=35128 RepID=B8C755_THAPS|nr:predicted protein [Thalassiosira pseudonana CCMP1335]EED90921.1 predicted protein [Thalassiosira pseudonana CCMP1335]|eukprot:scaffold106_cov209-Alexandrium_tamarense.AAC.42
MKSISVVFLIVLHQASSLSSMSPLIQHKAAATSPQLNAYHFGVSYQQQQRTEQPRPILRKRPTSYIPDGLTEEEYNTIKQNDRAKLQGKDFGAWGPRFNRIDGDPEGSWFSIPSLWTGGFNAGVVERRAVLGVQKVVDGDNGVGEMNGMEGVKTRVAYYIKRYLRRYGLAYLALVLSSHVVARSLSSAAKKGLTAKGIAVRIVPPLLALKPIQMMTIALSDRFQFRWLKEIGTTKMAMMLGMMMTVLSFALR